MSPETSCMGPPRSWSRPPPSRSARGAEVGGPPSTGPPPISMDRRSPIRELGSGIT